MEINLKEYKTMAALEAARKEINEAFDKRAEDISLLTKANEISDKSFGFIKESFENISPVLFETSDGRNIIARYKATIKSNKSLSLMHTLYENVRKTSKNSDVDFFINSISSINENIDKKEMSEGRSSLGRILAEGYLTIGKNAEELFAVENPAFDNAMEYIAENKKATKNISEYSSAVKILRENIEKNDKVENIFTISNADAVIVKKLKEYNEKYKGQLTTEEETVVKEVASSSKPSAVFEKYKNSCKERMMEAKVRAEQKGDSALVSRLDSLYEQISNKEYSVDTIGEDICNLVKLSNIFVD